MMNKILVNIITLSRFLLSIILAYYIVTDKNHIIPVTVLFAMICFSDLMDGKLARRLAVSSRMGAYLDVLADLFFMLSAGIALIFMRSYPIWMLFVIIGKFIEFWCTSSLVSKNRRYGKQIFISDNLGRKVAVAFYLLPYIAFLSDFCLNRNLSFLIINILCIPVALGACVSSIQRIKSCIKYRSTIYNT